MKNRITLRGPIYKVTLEGRYPKPYGALLLLSVLLYNWCVLSYNTTHDSTIVNTLTGPDLYTGLQWQTPFDGSDLRRGIELKHIP